MSASWGCYKGLELGGVFCSNELMALKAAAVSG